MIRFHIHDSPRSLLIQDVHELRAQFRQVWHHLSNEQLDEEDALRWLIADWLRVRHRLHVWDHDPHRGSMQAMKRHLIAYSEYPINELCERFILAPVLYANRDITIDIRGVDLYIWYFK